MAAQKFRFYLQGVLEASAALGVPLSCFQEALPVVILDDEQSPVHKGDGLVVSPSL